MCVYILYCVTLSISKLGKPHCNQDEAPKECHDQDDEAKECRNCAATLIGVLWRALWIERYAVSTMHTKNNGLASTTFPLNNCIYICIFI